MWTRKELKDKAKRALAMNYWKTVLVALLALAISGGIGAASRVSSGSSSESTEIETIQMTEEELDALTSDEGMDDINTLPEMVQVPSDDEAITALGIAAITGIAVLVLVVGAVAVAFAAFVINPLKVGVAKFFVNDLNRPAELKDVVYGYENNYRETVKTMFWRDIYTVLWGLLLVIPGIVKAYEYSMIPYLLAEDPAMTKERAFAESKRLMSGQKWKAFVLDLSFIGWMLLSLVTLGLALIFYVQPYKCLTAAALYERLRYGNEISGQGSYATAIPASAVPVPPYAAADAPQPVWDDSSYAAGDAVQAPVVDDQPEA